MKSNRIARVNDEMLREISNVIRSELKDPRVSAMTSVTKVDTASDLSHAKVYVSILGDDSQKAEVMEGLKNAVGFIRSQLAASINLRVTPKISFVLDDSLEYGMKIDRMLREIHEEGERGEQ